MAQHRVTFFDTETEATIFRDNLLSDSVLFPIEEKWAVLFDEEDEERESWADPFGQEPPIREEDTYML